MRMVFSQDYLPRNRDRVPLGFLICKDLIIRFCHFLVKNGLLTLSLELSKREFNPLLKGLFNP